MNVKVRIGHSFDIDGVHALQAKNLYSNLTEKERSFGFVTTPFTKAQILEIISKKGLFVALNDKNTVIAYVFAGSWEYFKQWEIFNFMAARFPQLRFDGRAISTTNTFQYGPVCINKNYRGQGVFNLIFEEMRIEFLKNYPISITFINRLNIISEKAHIKNLGWAIIDEFEFNDNQYIGLAFDMKKSVLKKL